MRRPTIYLTAAWLIIPFLALLGCAGPQTQQALPTKSTEDLLSAAGFKQIFPTTPQQKTHLNSIPQKQIFMVDRGGKLSYVYADAAGCGCLYVGNPQKYQAFQNLAAQYRAAAMQYQAARMEMDSAAGWGPWGQWGPWGDWGEAGTFN